MNEPEKESPSVRPAAKQRPPIAKAGGALMNWLRATFIDAVLVGILWLAGLWLLHIPLAPLWALIGAMAQFIPNVGGMLALIGPSLTLLFTGGGWEKFGLLLGLYAGIVVIDQLGLQPWLMKKNARVPIWASIFGPILLGTIIPFWGVLLAPPVLAVIFAFRKPRSQKA